MADGIKVEIVSPERLVLSVAASSVTVPGLEGYFTVLGEHAPLISMLKPGFITVEGGGTGPSVFYVRGGFVEVSPDGVTILAEQSQDVSQFEKAEIDAILADARAKLAAAQSDVERDAAQILVHSFENLLSEVEHMGPAISM